jgi:hypothetical protein
MMARIASISRVNIDLYRSANGYMLNSFLKAPSSTIERISQAKPISEEAHVKAIEAKLGEFDKRMENSARAN